MTDHIVSESLADVRLEGRGGAVCLQRQVWATLIQTAIDKGWRPEWRREMYVANVGLDVGALDARKFARAIAKVLNEETSRGGAAVLAGDSQSVEDLIRLCRAGCFRIGGNLDRSHGVDAASNAKSTEPGNLVRVKFRR